MSYKQLMKPGGILTALVLGVGLSPTAFGATAAATQVDNLATVDYEVNAQPQDAVDSNTETFFVDVAVDFVLNTNDGSAVQVELGDTEYTQFTLTNNSNSSLYFSFAAGNASGLTAFGTTDESGGAADVSGFAILNDDAGGGTVGVFDGSEPDITSSQIQVAGDGGTVNLLVAADAPSTGTNGDIAVIDLIATMVDSDGSAVVDGTQANSLDDTTFDGMDDSVQIAFVEDVGGKANPATDTTGDNDGSAADASAYELLAADVEVTKSNSIIDDTLGGSAYHVPGAIIEYTISIENFGDADADAVTLVDAIDTTNLTYLDDDQYGTGDVRITDFPDGEDGGVAGECDGGAGTTTVYDENAGDGSTSDNGGDVLYDDTNDEIEVLPALGLSVPADTCVRIEFRVTIN